MAITRSFKALAVVLLAAAFVYGCTNERESRRVHEVFAVLIEKLKAYKKQNGDYPASLTALSMTNSPTEIKMQTDLQKISYERIQSGYRLTYRGDDGLLISNEYSSDETN